MTHDPYTNTQTKFLRTDPTGRWSPIYEREEVEPWWIPIIGSILFAVCLAFALAAFL